MVSTEIEYSWESQTISKANFVADVIRFFLPALKNFYSMSCGYSWEEHLRMLENFDNDDFVFDDYLELNQYV